MIRKIQLLAHAGAPSARGDEERYRAQLDAYLEIQGAPSRLSVEFVGANHVGERTADADAHLTIVPTCDTTFVDDTQLAYQGLDSQLVTSSLLDLVGSPPGNRPITDHGQSSASKSPDSPRTSRKRKLDVIEAYSGPVRRPTALFAPLLEDGQLGLAYIGDRPVQSTENGAPTDYAAHSQDLDPDETNSELPTSYSLSDITSQSSRAKQQDAGHRSQPRPNQDAERGQDEGPQMENSVEQRSPEAAGVMRNAAIHHVAEQREPSSLRQPNRNDDHDTVASLSTNVLPPEPKAGRERFTFHVTEALQSLADNPTIGHKYEPLRVTRDLRALERGYWLVDCSSWQLSSQIDFWHFLDRTIRRGSLGWGVWCTREDEGLTKDDKCGSIGAIKVFCWGEVVKHVFLLLYVASNSQVKKIGLSWIDAEGTAVVQMQRK